MRLIAEQINALGVPGDVAELGVYRGDFAVLLNLAFSERRLHLFDTFDGFDERDIAAERENSYSGAKAGDFGDTAKDGVDKRLFSREACSTRDFSRIRSKAAKICAFAPARSTRISMRQLPRRCPFSVDGHEARS